MALTVEVLVVQVKIKGEIYLECNLNYDEMSREELVQICIDRDATIQKCFKSIEAENTNMLNKCDIMNIYHCESDKALRILKIMFQMGYGNKIGKEYYISRKSQTKFVNDMAGREVFI